MDDCGKVFDLHVLHHATENPAGEHQAGVREVRGLSEQENKQRESGIGAKGLIRQIYCGDGIWRWFWGGRIVFQRRERRFSM